MMSVQSSPFHGPRVDRLDHPEMMPAFTLSSRPPTPPPLTPLDSPMPLHQTSASPTFSLQQLQQYDRLLPSPSEDHGAHSILSEMQQHGGDHSSYHFSQVDNHEHSHSQHHFFEMMPHSSPNHSFEQHSRPHSQLPLLHHEHHHSLLQQQHWSPSPLPRQLQRMVSPVPLQQPVRIFVTPPQPRSSQPVTFGDSDFPPSRLAGTDIPASASPSRVLGDSSQNLSSVPSSGRPVAQPPAANSVASSPDTDRLTLLWNRLADLPALDAYARARVAHLDEIVIAITELLHERMGEHDDVHRALDACSEMFVQAGKRIVERCALARDIAFSRPLIRSTSDLLYDASSSSADGASDDCEGLPPLEGFGGATTAAKVQPEKKRRTEKGTLDLTVEAPSPPPHEKSKQKKHSKSSSIVSPTTVRMIDEGDDAEGEGGSSEAVRNEQQDEEMSDGPPRSKEILRRKSSKKARDSDEEDYDVEGSSAHSSSNSRKRKSASSSSFSSAAVSILRRWLQAHLDDPYPDHHQKEELAEQAGLSYHQVGHWFINARMRYWRPMLRSQQALLASGVKLEDISADADATSDEDASANEQEDPSLSLNDLSSLAASAAPTDLTPSSLSKSELFHQKLTDLVPRSGRSYMVAGGARSTKKAYTPRSLLSGLAAGGATAGTSAEIIAASTLALQISSSVNYQTPHSYISSHPLHKGKYKSGGHKVKTEPSEQSKKLRVKKEKV